MTNGDIIRSMTDEQLAQAIMCPNDAVLDKIECDKSDNKNCIKCCYDWLQQRERKIEDGTD